MAGRHGHSIACVLGHAPGRGVHRSTSVRFLILCRTANDARITQDIGWFGLNRLRGRYVWGGPGGSGVPLEWMRTGALWDKFFARTITFIEEPRKSSTMRACSDERDKHDMKARSKKFEEVDRSILIPTGRANRRLIRLRLYNAGRLRQRIGAATRYVPCIRAAPTPLMPII